MDSSFQKVTVKPIIDIWTENGEGCTPLDVKFNFNTTEKIESFLWGFGDGEESAEEKPMHTYINSGLEDILFDVQLKVVSAEGCKNNGIISNKIVVHPSPSVDFSFDEGICYNETSSVWYEGSGTEDDYYVWDLSNFQPGEILKDPGNTQGPLEFKRSSEPYINIGGAPYR